MSVRVGREQSGRGRVTSLQENGDKVTWGLRWLCPTMERADAIRRMIVGYNNAPDEAIIPIVWDEDTTKTGYYELGGTTVSSTRTLYDQFLLDATIQTKLVGGGGYPQLQSTLTGADRAGKPSGITAGPWWTWPDTWNGIALVPGLGSLGGNPRNLSATNHVTLTHNTAFYGAGFALYSGVPPKAFYDAAATVMCAPSTTAYPVTGLQFPAQSASWYITNGLVRVWGSATNACAMQWLNAAGTAWGGMWPVAHMFWNGYPALVGTSARSVTILRNSPEEVIIRQVFPYGTSDVSGTITVDMSLRRGTRVPIATVRSDLFNQFGLVFRTFGSGVWLDTNYGAVVEGANNSDGNRNMMLSSEGPGIQAANGTAPATNGTMYPQYGNTTATIGVGSVVGGSSAIAPDTSTYVQQEFYAAISESCHVVRQ